ncbi:hypothetical protein ATANTOWER_030393 [Ataeniobius toweri]|uniref:NTR domain-containing protein n=1 Tax=Ataeniobius toweri TaxID=208326 RepID=A0ABU7C7N6_9TELE|nr:hypothetical protein [Ataeniobius toweri]
MPMIGVWKPLDRNSIYQFSLAEKITEDEKIYRVKIQVLFKNRNHDAVISVLDVDLPTGFIFNKADLDALSTGHSRVISKYDTHTYLSERGSLILYLDKISHIRPEEISFRIHQETKEGILQPAAVKVYEYYDQNPCVKFYNPERNGSLSKLCINGHCLCTQEKCSSQKKDKINNDERLLKSCDSTVDFVYKVTVEDLTESVSADVYTLRILYMIREGEIDGRATGKQRKFLAKKTCKEALDLQTGKTYLIMGSSKDIHRDYQNFSYWYELLEDTWVEYWPSQVECQTETHMRACMGLDDMETLLTSFGCAVK